VFCTAALAATAAGRKSFARLNYKPTGYRELFVRLSGCGDEVALTCIIPGSSQGTAPIGDDDKTDDLEVVSSTVMMVRYEEIQPCSAIMLG
jgi:hypothetical protein